MPGASGLPLVVGPDAAGHSTIARFRAHHSKVFQDSFAQALDLVRRNGLGRAITIVLDGTKLKDNAALEKDKSLVDITKELMEAAQIKDLAGNAKFGKRRGDELPKHLKSARRARRSGATNPRRRAQAGTCTVIPFNALR